MKNTTALRFIKRLIHRKAIVFCYFVFRSALNATAPFITFDMYYYIVWFICISALTAVLTIYDKIAAQRGSRRIPEKTLLFCGFSGGAAVEFIIMRIIRHKTRKKKFMITLPLFMVLHTALFALLIYCEVISW